MHTPKLIMLLLVMAFFVGCPPIWQKYDFTNADLSYTGYRDGFFDGLPSSNTDAEGEGKETREVVEPDVIRRNGDILYILNQYRGLTLINLAGSSPSILAQVPTFGYPRDLYVVDNRAYVLVGYASDYQIDGNTVSFSIASRLYVVDVSIPEQAAILTQFDLQGDLVDSRLVGNVLYAVCAEYEWYWDEAVDGRAKASIVKAQTSASWVTSVNVADPQNIQKVEEISFEGLGNVIHATNFAIFVSAPTHWPYEETTITYVDISDPAGAMDIRGNIKIKGYVADRYKMDAYDGVLRVVSNKWNDENGRATFISTIDLADPDNLTPLGETLIEDASGETLFATRFDGPRAYIVTYLVKDPLFVVDLSDPTQPRVGVNPLVVPGWSTHIEPRGDRLIALGVDDTDGRRVSCSMYDVSDPDNPAQVGDRVTFGESWSWSSAYSDVKAFTVLDDVIIVPFSGWESDFGGYDRLQFISYTEKGLEGRGYVDVTGEVLRSFEYGGMYYGVTTEQLTTIDGSDLAYPEVVHRLTLAEYVADFIELSPTLGAEVVTEYDAGKTIVKTVGLGKTLGQVEVEVGTLMASFAYGQSLVVVGSIWNSTEYKSHYVLAVVDCSTPTAPEVAAHFKLDVQPYWGGWYWWIQRPGVLEIDKSLDMATKSVIGPWWRWNWRPGAPVFPVNDILALRCTSDTYQSVFGNSNASQGLALVNLNTLAVTTVGLGLRDVVSIDQVADKLYVGTKEYAGTDWLQPLCAYYLRELDVEPLSMGPAVNVPGVFVQYDPEEDLLIVRDDQWDNSGSVKNALRSLSWNGGALIEPLNEVDMPANVCTLLGRGEKIYFDAYDDGYKLYAASVENDGKLALGTGLLVTKQWASLLDAQGDTALVTVGNAIAQYQFGGAGTLIDVYQTMGSPLSVRFGAERAYVPLGYAGVALIPF